jgi:predicted metal-dependent phosphoesterase TrpH
MELSCLLEGHSVHLLAYLFDPDDPALNAETELIRDDRIHRAKAMVGKLRELGAPVTWDQVMEIAGGAVVGRPHIARALALAGVVETPADAFTKEWIGDGGRAHVGRYAPDPARAISLVRAAGGVPVLAHPRSPGYEITDEVIIGLAAAGLAGVEVWHPDHDHAERTRLAALASRLGLVATGGSDDHGSFNDSGLGSQTTPPEEYERLLSQAVGAHPVTGRPAPGEPR